MLLYGMPALMEDAGVGYNIEKKSECIPQINIFNFYVLGATKFFQKGKSHEKMQV
jgi:hypothetical protein